MTSTPIPLYSPYHRTWWALAVRGAFALLVGIFIFSRPLRSVAFFALLIAFWALLIGIIQIVRAVALRQDFRAWWVVLLDGIINIVFGIVALIYYPIPSLALVVIWIAWWLIAEGLASLYLAFHERATGISWGWTLALGVLEVLAGVAALVFPRVTLSIALGLIAWFACISGIVLLIAASRSYQYGRHERRVHVTA